MQMLQSDWLSHCTLSGIGVQWLGVVNKIAMFGMCFSEVSIEKQHILVHVETNKYTKFLRILKGGHLQFLVLKIKS